MKLLFYFLLIFGCSLSVFAQNDNYRSDNKERLHEIDQLIKESISTQDYSTAADLKKEKDIRLELEQAFKNDAPQKEIIEIEQSLVDCDCTASLDDEMEDLQDDIHKWKHRTIYTKDNFVLYFEFLVMNYLNTATNYHDIIYTYDEFGNYAGSHHEDKRSFEDKFGLGFRVGGSYYFGDPVEKPTFRVGLDMLFFSFTVGMSNEDMLGPFLIPDMIILNFPEPGIVVNQFLSDKTGIEYRANFGISKGFGLDLTGMNARLSIQGWTGKFSFGLDYQYTTSIINEKFNSTRVHQIGLTVGMRF